MRAPRDRRIFYFVAPVLAPLLALLLLEGGLRGAGISPPSVTTDPGRGFLPFASLFQRQGDQLVIETPPHDLPFMNLKQFNAQSIPASKAPGEVRVLVVGGSVVYGWPFDDRLSIPRVLEAGLRAAAPDVSWRVINLGAPGWGSTRLRLLTPDLVQLQADAVVLMTGHNEGIEAELAQEVTADRRGRLRLLSRASRRSHLVTWMITHLPPLERFTAGDAQARRRAALTSVSEQRGALVAQLRENLLAMVDTHQRAGSTVLLANLPANVRGCPPFGPDPSVLAGADPERAMAYEAALADPVGSLDAIAALRGALPSDANVAYLWARGLDGAGRLEEAAAAYQEALELDPVIVRAFPSLNAATAQVAQDRGAPLVDLVAVMAEATGGLPGDDVFRDNCHPNEVGIALLSEALGRGLADAGVFAGGPGWEERFAAASAQAIADVELPLDLQLEALKFELFYFKAMNRDPVRERATREAIALLDPEGRASLP